MNGMSSRFGSSAPRTRAFQSGSLHSIEMQMPDALKHLFEIMLVLALCFLIIGYNTGLQSSETEDATANEEGGYNGAAPEGLEPIEEELEEVEQGVGISGTIYTEVGTVYRDETGQFYVVGNDSGGGTASE